MIAERLLKEIRARLGFLGRGLDYLTLSRAAGTLAGERHSGSGLATQIGSGLVGVLYILDEPLRSVCTSGTTGGCSTR